VRLAHWREAIADVARIYPLIHLERETRYPDECWIGFPLEVTGRQLVINRIDANGEWTGPYRMRLGDITRLDFGGGYERALAMTASWRPARKPRRL
jgi:hypothetical protein